MRLRRWAWEARSPPSTLGGRGRAQLASGWNASPAGRPGRHLVSICPAQRGPTSKDPPPGHFLCPGRPQGRHQDGPLPPHPSGAPRSCSAIHTDTATPCSPPSPQPQAQQTRLDATDEASGPAPLSPRPCPPASHTHEPHGASSRRAAFPRAGPSAQNPSSLYLSACPLVQMEPPELPSRVPTCTRLPASPSHPRTRPHTWLPREHLTPWQRLPTAPVRTRGPPA